MSYITDITVLIHMYTLHLMQVAYLALNLSRRYWRHSWIQAIDKVTETRILHHAHRSPRQVNEFNNCAKLRFVQAVIAFVRRLLTEKVSSTAFSCFSLGFFGLEESGVIVQSMHLQKK